MVDEIVGIYGAFKARKSLRALRGLVRLQSGHKVMRQSSTTMQAPAHVQGRIRGHRVRMSEEGLAVQHQMWQRGQPTSRKASDGSTEAGWNDSTASAQQIEAKVQERQVAALKRERALAYARTQQQMRRASPISEMPLFIECEVEKAHWGWSYMERWSSARAASPRSWCGSDDAEESGSVAGSATLSGTARSTTSILTDPQFGPVQQLGAGPQRCDRGLGNINNAMILATY